MFECVARSRNISRDFVSGAEIQPRFRIAGIQLHCSLIRLERCLNVRLFQIELLKVTQPVPIFRIFRFQPRGNVETLCPKASPRTTRQSRSATQKKTATGLHKQHPRR